MEGPGDARTVSDGVPLSDAGGDLLEPSLIEALLYTDDYFVADDARILCSVPGTSPLTQGCAPGPGAVPRGDWKPLLPRECAPGFPFRRKALGFPTEKESSNKTERALDESNALSP